MSTKESKPMEVRNDADLQAIQTSVAFKNISDAVEQYRRQFGLAFLALIAFSAIHVGLVVIANLYTMQTRIVGQTMTVAGDEAATVGTAQVIERRSLSYVMTNLAEEDQITSLRSMKSVSFVDREDNFRQYTVTGFQLGGWKRSELKLYTSVGHVLEYVRGKGVRVFSEDSTTACNFTGSDSRKLLQASWSLRAPPPSPPPPPYSTIAEQMLIDCNVVSTLNGRTGCSDDGSGMVYTTFSGIDADTDKYTGTWAHNKALYDQHVWIGKLLETDSETIYKGGETQVTMDVVTGETSFVMWNDSAGSDSKYEGMVTEGAASTLFDGSSNSAVSSKVTSNLGALADFAGGLGSYAARAMTTHCDDAMLCDHSGLVSDVASHIGGSSDLKKINSDTDAIKTMFGWNAGYTNRHQTIPGLKIMYNYGKGQQIYSNDDDEVAKASEDLDDDYYTGQLDDFNQALLGMEEQQARMYRTYVINDDDSGVATFSAAQERAFSTAQADTAVGETIWGTGMASSFTAGYPEIGKITYADIDDLDEASMYKSGILDAIGDFAKATEVIGTIWGNLQAGYSGLSREQLAETTDNIASTKIIWSRYTECSWGKKQCSGAQYGCSGSGINDLRAFDSPIFYWAYEKCSAMHADVGLLEIDGVSNAIGGVFFSPTLGGFESYAVYLPPKFCQIMMGKDGEGSIREATAAMGREGNQMEFVFMLHGWGGHCDFIDGLAMVMDEVFSSCSPTELLSGACKNLSDIKGTVVVAAMNGFVVFAPEDGSTPYGTKTWYQDNEFTGLHQTFLQNELIATADSLLQVVRRTVGLFGFSQGGVGSILMSLGSTAYSGIASFNGPLMPADCFFKNECHQECGVDFIMCELLWSSVLVGMLPFVTVKFGYLMHSTGTTDPMDQGTCVVVKGYGHAKCVMGRLPGVQNKLLMWQYLFYPNLKTMHTESYARKKNGPFRFCPDWRARANQCDVGISGTSVLASHYYYPEYYGPGKEPTSFYYLDPKYFGMAVQHFIPTHNIMTNAANQVEFEKFLGRTPFFRLWESPSSYSGYKIALSLLISVDTDDEFGLLRTTQAFAWMLVCDGSILTGFSGVWAYDNPEDSDTGGHVYNYHDTILTLQWFSEVFRSFSSPNGLSNEIMELYMQKGAPTPMFDEFGMAASYELMTSMDYTTCYLWQLNTGATGQYSREILQSKITNPANVCSQSNGLGKQMLYPAVDVNLDAADVGTVEASNKHAGLHADLDSFKERHEDGAGTDVFSCYLATTSDDMYEPAGQDPTPSFITKIFDCNVYGYLHGDSGTSDFGDGQPPAGTDCDFYDRFPTSLGAGTVSRAEETPRTGAYAECAGAFPSF